MCLLAALHAADSKELRLVTDALDTVTAAGCPQQPILVLQPSAVTSRQSAASPRFIMGRKLHGGDDLDSLQHVSTRPAPVTQDVKCCCMPFEGSTLSAPHAELPKKLL